MIQSGKAVYKPLQGLVKAFRPALRPVTDGVRQTPLAAVGAGVRDGAMAGGKAVLAGSGPYAAGLAARGMTGGPVGTTGEEMTRAFESNPYVLPDASKMTGGRFFGGMIGSSLAAPGATLERLGLPSYGRANPDAPGVRADVYQGGRDALTALGAGAAELPELVAGRLGPALRKGRDFLAETATAAGETATGRGPGIDAALKQRGPDYQTGLALGGLTDAVLAEESANAPLGSALGLEGYGPPSAGPVPDTTPLPPNPFRAAPEGTPSDAAPPPPAFAGKGPGGLDPSVPVAKGPGEDGLTKALPPELSDPAKSKEVAANLGRIVGADASKALEDAAKAPPPADGTLAAYWDKLPKGSRLLAIAGLSLAAITTLRSMFGSGGEEDEEGFLMKVLPFLGLGAAAWGLGGGTLGLSKENLPSMAHFERLGSGFNGNLKDWGLDLGLGRGAKAGP